LFSIEVNFTKINRRLFLAQKKNEALASFSVYVYVLAFCSYKSEKGIALFFRRKAGEGQYIRHNIVHVNINDLIIYDAYSLDRSIVLLGFVGGGSFDE